MEVFKDEDDEVVVKKWRRLMAEITQSGSAVPILRSQRGAKGEALPRDLVLGTLVRFKQLKRWNIVSEVIFTLWTFFSLTLCSLTLLWKIVLFHSWVLPTP